MLWAEAQCGLGEAGLTCRGNAALGFVHWGLLFSGAHWGAYHKGSLLLPKHPS